MLRSFGKFYGLPGLRLGFALGPPSEIEALAALAGPWPVSGPALALGAAALADTAWAAATRARLAAEAPRLDALAARAGWGLVGGTDLFRTYDTPDAALPATASRTTASGPAPFLGRPAGSASACPATRASGVASPQPSANDLDRPRHRASISALRRSPAPVKRPGV